MPAASFLLAAVLAAACGPSPPAETAVPPGALVVTEVSALDSLLARIELAAGTPAGLRAAGLRRALPSCAIAYGRDPQGDLLRALEALRCGAEVPPALEALRAGRALAFSLPLRAASALANAGESADPARHTAALRPLRGSVALDPEGRVSLQLELPRESVSAALSLLLPGSEPAGAPLLASNSALIRARVRPAGSFALASLIPAASQGDRLFQLRSALFSELVLDGSWELAVYLPEAPLLWPRVALALGLRNRAAAEQALAGFLAELAKSWPLPQREVLLGGARALCLPELRLLPELAPCAQVGERALTLGWNAASLEHALEGEKAEIAAPAARAASTLYGAQSADVAARGAALAIELARVPEADALLAGNAPATAAAAAAAAAWQRLLAGGSAQGSDYALWLELEPLREATLATAPIESARESTLTNDARESEHGTALAHSGAER